MTIDKISSYSMTDIPFGLSDCSVPDVLIQKGAIDSVFLKQSAQFILDIAIVSALQQQSMNLNSSIMWEQIRQQVASACYKLVESNSITSYRLQETDTNDVEGWSLQQGVGKVFVLWLTIGNTIVSSDQKAITAQI